MDSDGNRSGGMSLHTQEEILQWHLTGGLLQRVEMLSRSAQDAWVTDVTCVQFVIVLLTEFVCVCLVVIEGR